jgi:hypothetical protein
VNHYGIVRAFATGDVRRPGAARRVTPVWTRQFVADVERIVVVRDRLVGSRPREEGRPGLLVSDPLAPNPSTTAIHASVTLEDWRPVRAMASASARGTAAIAVGGDAHVGWASLRDGIAVLDWETEVHFAPAVIVGDGGLLWAAGSEAGAAVDDYDWDALHGGGFAALDAHDGHVVVAGRFPGDLAWGTGGVAVALTSGAVWGLGRRGEHYVFDRCDGTLLATTAPGADASLGIAHAAAIGDRVLYGFNRAGYRLWTAGQDGAPSFVPGSP